MSEANLNDPNWDRQSWLAKHDGESWKDAIAKVVPAIKAQGVTRIGTVGYCFGAPPALLLGIKNEAHVTVLTHPSRLEVPQDFEVSPQVPAGLI